MYALYVNCISVLCMIVSVIVCCVYVCSCIHLIGFVCKIISESVYACMHAILLYYCKILIIILA